jgi:peptidoglycan/xylan/chitin deacetylase (PgdA/CDA1 family)
MSEFRWPEGRSCAVSLSFDDARPSQVDNGLPVLREHGARATFFVVREQMRQREEGWRQALADGHELGNHSVKHPCSGNFPWARDRALEDYDLPRMERELVQASDELESFMGQRPISYAYCCGQKFVGRGEQTRSYVPVVARHFRVGRGFRDECPCDPAFTDLAQVSGRDFDGSTCERMLGWVDNARRHGHWLALAGHDIGQPLGQSVGSRELDEFLRTLRAMPDVWIDTIGTVGSHIHRTRGY